MFTNPADHSSKNLKQESGKNYYRQNVKVFMSVVHYMPEMDQQVQSFENLFSIKWTKTSTFIVFTRIKAAALIKFSHLSSVAVLLRGRLLFESWLPLIASGLQRLFE